METIDQDSAKNSPISPLLSDQLQSISLEEPSIQKLAGNAQIDNAETFAASALNLCSSAVTSNNSDNELFDVDPFAAAADEIGIDRVLYNALHDPKQRLFMLKLELDCENFVSSSSSDMSRTMEYPSLNSFRRLIVHRVGELFGLERYVDTRRQAIILSLTADTKLPSIRLRDISYEQVQDHGDTGEQSNPSIQIIPRHSNIRTLQKKPESKQVRKSINPHSHEETNDDSKQTSFPFAKAEALSIKEREALYQEARARIFDETESSDLEATTSDTSQSRPTPKYQERQFNPRPPRHIQIRPAWTPPHPILLGPYFGPTVPVMPMYRPPHHSNPISFQNQQLPPHQRVQHMPQPIPADQRYLRYPANGTPSIQYPYYNDYSGIQSTSTDGSVYYVNHGPMLASTTYPINTEVNGAFYEPGRVAQPLHGYHVRPYINAGSSSNTHINSVSSGNLKNNNTSTNIHFPVQLSSDPPVAAPQQSDIQNSQFKHTQEKSNLDNLQ
ncbi:hypothetical protein O5D80_001144 [Batrachochytrium dendrobatidis]|nr:hypothetical protein O5D80_001144 [Batrachochytrium dendrobatidis]